MGREQPIYIVSKGRWDTRFTMKSLDRAGVPYFIVVEAQEREHYVAAVNPDFATVLTLDPAYQRDYDTCDDLGDSKGKGPGPARNFAWDHAKANGAVWHWVMDDNIRAFYRFNRNKKTVDPNAGDLLGHMERFCARFENVAMGGPDYVFFADTRNTFEPFLLNTRIYSCNLIRNDVPFRWRGRYNEDTILSLDMLKAGWCTVQFNAFLQDKRTTQKMRGGNTDEFYSVEGTLPKSRMLVGEHPDVCRLAWRFGRPHHFCDYRPFKANKLIRKPGVVIPEGVNEYGMKLVRLQPTAAD